METYHVLMGDPTEEMIDLVFKHGAVLAEVCPPFPVRRTALYFHR
jgi:hypothetical protein